MTEMLSAGRVYKDRVATKPGAETGNPHIWFFTAVLRSIEKVLASRTSTRTTKIREGGSGKDAQGDTTTASSQQPQEMLTWVKACRHLPEPRSRTSPQMDPSRTSGRSRRARGTSGSHAFRWRRYWRRRKTQLTNGGCTRKNQARPETLLRARASGQSPPWIHAKTATQFASEGRKRENRGSDADGAGKQSALSQGLLDRWRRRGRVRLGASNNKKRARVSTGCVACRSGPKIWRIRELSFFLCVLVPATFLSLSLLSLDGGPCALSLRVRG